MSSGHCLPLSRHQTLQTPALSRPSTAWAMHQWASSPAGGSAGQAPHRTFAPCAAGRRPIQAEPPVGRQGARTVFRGGNKPTRDVGYPPEARTPGWQLRAALLKSLPAVWGWRGACVSSRDADVCPDRFPPCPSSLCAAALHFWCVCLWGSRRTACSPPGDSHRQSRTHTSSPPVNVRAECRACSWINRPPLPDSSQRARRICLHNNRSERPGARARTAKGRLCRWNHPKPLLSRSNKRQGGMFNVQRNSCLNLVS